MTHLHHVVAVFSGDGHRTDSEEAGTAFSVAEQLRYLYQWCTR